MRVNIKGRGIVPRVGKLAPVYNQDLQKNDIEFLLSCNQFKVYETKTGLLITRATVDEMFAKSQKPVEVKKPEPTPTTAPVVEEPVVAELVEEEKVDVVEETLPEITEEVVEEESIAEPETVEEDEVVETVEEETEEESTEEENTEGEQSDNTSNKKKKKRRR